MINDVTDILSRWYTHASSRKRIFWPNLASPDHRSPICDLHSQRCYLLNTLNFCLINWSNQIIAVCVFSNKFSSSNTNLITQFCFFSSFPSSFHHVVWRSRQWRRPLLCDSVKGIVALAGRQPGFVSSTLWLAYRGLSEFAFSWLNDISAR